jgi:hypothetical protein
MKGKSTMKKKMPGNNCINLEAVRMQRQIDILERYFPRMPREDIEELRKRSPEKNREVIKILMLYVNASPEERAAFRAYVERGQKEKVPPPCQKRK